jgi:hypothetical protein
VKVWEDKIVLPTYPEEPPDPNPDLSIFNAMDTPSYPYPLRLKFSGKRNQQSWRTLNLENEYLACRVMPDLGGHLYNCRDKISNREVFYANPVIKKARVGPRGSWVAMGIESNFPVGHSYTSTSPVDFATREDPDGAAAVIIGNIDRITGMQWRVEYVLRPASAVLEERVVLYNRSSVRHRYYWWANAAIEYNDKNTRAIFPTRVMSVHETGELIPWPAGADRIDLSLIANHPTGRGFFAYGSREPFMAIFKPGSRTGIAHFSDTGAIGKKLWVWGPDGDDHVKTDLTDHFNSYIEMQAGLFQNQLLFEYLNPQEIRRFTEYWIPFRDMDGLSRANPNAAVLFEREKGKGGRTELNVQVMTTERAPSAKVEVTCGAATILSATADIGPSATFSKQIESESQTPCTLRVSSGSGAVLIEHRENRYNIDDPSKVKFGKQSNDNVAAPDTEAFLTARATSSELSGRLRFAWQDYNRALEKAPGDAALHKAAGRLAVTLARGEEGRKHEAAALAANPGDEEAAYYLGLAHELLNADSEARSAFAQVKPGSPFFYAAQLELAFVAARTGDLKSAIDYASHAADNQAGASRVRAVRVALLRRAGQKDAAASEAAHWVAVDPIDAMLRFERVQLAGKDDELWAHLAADPERILNVVDDYIALGFYDTALQLLEHDYPENPANQVEPGSPSPQHHALLLYYRAYCRSKTGAGADWTAASRQPTRYVFPNRVTSYPVLRAAVAQNPKDGVAHYLLGLLYMNSLEKDKAVAEWQLVRSLSPDLEGLEQNLAKAAHADGNVAAGAGPQAGTAVAAMLKAASGTLPDIGKIPDADEPAEVRQAYIEVQLQRLLSLAQSKKCDEALSGIDGLGNNGFDKFVKYPHFQYYLGVVEERCGREKAARKRWSRITIRKDRLPAAESVFPYIAAALVDPAGTKDDTAAALRSIETEIGKPENASHTWLLFAQGMLMRVAGYQQKGLEILKTSSAITIDPLVQYLSLTELRLAVTP